MVVFLLTFFITTKPMEKSADKNKLRNNIFKVCENPSPNPIRTNTSPSPQPIAPLVRILIRHKQIPMQLPHIWFMLKSVPSCKPKVTRVLRKLTPKRLRLTFFLRKSCMLVIISMINNKAFVIVTYSSSTLFSFP